MSGQLFHDGQWPDAPNASTTTVNVTDSSTGTRDDGAAAPSGAAAPGVTASGAAASAITASNSVHGEPTPLSRRTDLGSLFSIDDFNPFSVNNDHYGDSDTNDGDTVYGEARNGRW